MSNLIDQLHQLKNALINMGEKHQTAMSELNRYQTERLFSSDEVEVIQQQLSDTEAHNQQLAEALHQQQSHYQDLEQRYQTLAESHSLMSTELENAQNQIKVMAENNQKLIEKNRVAAEHTKIVLERLAKIDSDV